MIDWDKFEIVVQPTHNRHHTYNDTGHPQNNRNTILIRDVVHRVFDKVTLVGNKNNAILFFKCFIRCCMFTVFNMFCNSAISFCFPLQICYTVNQWLKTYKKEPEGSLTGNRFSFNPSLSLPYPPSRGLLQHKNE